MSALDKARAEAFGEDADPAMPRRRFFSCPCTATFTCPSCQRKIDNEDYVREYGDPDADYEFQRDGREWP